MYLDKLIIYDENDYAYDSNDERSKIGLFNPIKQFIEVLKNNIS